MIRVPELQETAKFHDRSGTDIAGPDPVSALVREMVEECEKGVDIERADLERAGIDAVPVSGKGREQPEVLGVARNDVSACSLVTGRCSCRQANCGGASWINYVPEMCSLGAPPTPDA